MSNNLTKCLDCGNNRADDYDIPEIICDICENNNLFSERKKEDHPCKSCRFIENAKHTCPCDILNQWVNKYHEVL